MVLLSLNCWWSSLFIAILAAMLLPALASAKEKGKQAYCINSLHQLDIVFHMYEDDNEDWLHHTVGGSPPNHGKWLHESSHEGGTEADP